MNAAGVTIDWSPLVTVAVQALAGLVLALGGWAITRLMAKLKVDKDDKIRGYLTTALNNAVDYGLEQSKTLVTGAHLDTTIKNQVVGSAVAYALQHVPDAVNKFADGNPEAFVQRRVEAILGARTNDVATQVAVAAASAPTTVVQAPAPPLPAPEAFVRR